MYSTYFLLWIAKKIVNHTLVFISFLLNSVLNPKNIRKDLILYEKLLDIIDHDKSYKIKMGKNERNIKW